MLAQIDIPTVAQDFCSGTGLLVIAVCRKQTKWERVSVRRGYETPEVSGGRRAGGMGAGTPTGWSAE